MKLLAALATTLALGLSSALAAAQFKDAPAVARAALPVVSEAATPDEYKKDAARHIYASYASRVRKGKLEPLLYGVAIVDTDVDAAGNVLGVTLRRPPAAAEVGPWIVRMIQGASPLPAPARMGPGKFTEIWLVEKAGTFQLDTLSEGQR
jgi:periplasmic protein TonB